MILTKKRSPHKSIHLLTTSPNNNERGGHLPANAKGKSASLVSIRENRALYKFFRSLFRRIKLVQHEFAIEHSV